MTLPHSLPPAFQSIRAENRGTDKRCTDGEILMTDSFLPLTLDEAIVPGILSRDTCYKRGSIPNSIRQQKRSLCFTVSLTFFLLRTYSISCTAGEGLLILDCLYLQIGWWPFVCRWPTLRWHLIPGEKKCVVMLYGTDSQPEEITNTVNATELHSLPVVRASLQTQREGEHSTHHYTDLNHVLPLAMQKWVKWTRDHW